MNELETIEFVDKMTACQKAEVYMNIWVNTYFSRQNGRFPISFENFCSKDNIEKHIAPDNWKELGFASKEWITLRVRSLYHAVYLNIK